MSSWGLAFLNLALLAALLAFGGVGGPIARICKFVFAGSLGLCLMSFLLSGRHRPRVTGRTAKRHQITRRKRTGSAPAAVRRAGLRDSRTERFLLVECGRSKPVCSMLDAGFSALDAFRYKISIRGIFRGILRMNRCHFESGPKTAGFHSLREE